MSDKRQYHGLTAFIWVSRAVGTIVAIGAVFAALYVASLPGIDEKMLAGICAGIVVSGAMQAVLCFAVADLCKLQIDNALDAQVSATVLGRMYAKRNGRG